ncbi:hypothetical protein NUSPORA_00485 [Nucleospora cyclopteri]
MFISKILQDYKNNIFVFINNFYYEKQENLYNKKIQMILLLKVFYLIQILLYKKLFIYIY